MPILRWVVPAVLLTPCAAMAGVRQWPLGLPPAASPVMEKIVLFHLQLLVLTGATFVLVAGLLLFALVRFKARTHPVPSKTDHSPVLEAAWTLVPAVILMTVAWLSAQLLAFETQGPPADVTVMAAGYADHWTYAFPKEGGFQYVSTVLPEALAKERRAPRLLGVDNPLVVPVNKTVEVIAVGAGVIQTWAVPALGVRVEAVPGRQSRAWFKATKTGTFYGQCMELCGPDHTVMPVEVKVVSAAEYRSWLADTKKRYAGRLVRVAMK